ncbi:HAD-like domain-containing protein [Hypoxylon trugodes]|uniref:HAD-like domain-containing protein n=1 Tax=Hypoxylon trugodes TaxID=326681 RepID=UPI00219A00F2|nr:HAD-like domain-containing protein [Hypoxylon trugodes]KAI1391040.1 HAD-like domain-containing protein [Hypoxylon trugodes]
MYLLSMWRVSRRVRLLPGSTNSTRVPSNYLNILSDHFSTITTRWRNGAEIFSKKKKRKMEEVNARFEVNQPQTYQNPTYKPTIPFNHNSNSLNINMMNPDEIDLSANLSDAEPPQLFPRNTSPTTKPKSERQLRHEERQEERKKELFRFSRAEKELAREPISAPSPESGGIPEPTPEYLQRAAFPPFQLPYARKLLVVIDLNGTILYRPKRTNPRYFIERPHARTFLRYCIETFKVVIWSSASITNVKHMCTQLLTPEQLNDVVAIWGRDRFNLTGKDYRARVMCYKRLTRLWKDHVIRSAHPEVANGKTWSQADTVLIDDSIEKARSEPYNLIQVPDFVGDADDPYEERVLPQVHDYINECARYVDVSTHIRDRPFQIEADQAPH